MFQPVDSIIVLHRVQVDTRFSQIYLEYHYCVVLTLHRWKNEMRRMDEDEHTHVKRE